VDEREAMTRALDLAWRGWGRVQPNPLVGAVVVSDGVMVGEGWHAEYGGPHAEVVALAQAGPAARGATVVVTLEPCAHHGKQPPCADALIAAGVQRVVVALPDPNPEAAGGSARLRAAGVDVTLGLLERTAADQNAAFLHRHRDNTRPFVALKLATTLDGRIADANGNSRWISGPEAREYVHWLRAGFDAIGVGGVTARADDPSLTVRGPIRPRVTPLRVVFAADGDLPATLDVVRTARATPTLAIVAPTAKEARLGPVETAGVEIMRSSDIAQCLASLRSRGVSSLLVEGGGRLAGALLAAGVVDRYYWVQSPLWLGMGAVPATAGVPGTGLADASRWRVSDRRALGEDTLLVVDRA
jgi:diaminohydroxyphosphoribosylaminopyrimidine deaminase/5-amino-6-(5-phosphoribosylamino)uracil reductase